MEGDVMEKRFVVLLLCLTTLVQLGSQRVSAQEDKITYVLEIAKLDFDVDPSGKTIAVRFAKSVPSDEAANDAKNWRVIGIDANGDVTSYQPVTAHLQSRPSKLVLLQMGVSLADGGELDRATHKIIIRYQQLNLPTVTLGPLHKKTE